MHRQKKEIPFHYKKDRKKARICIKSGIKSGKVLENPRKVCTFAPGKVLHDQLPLNSARS